MKEKVIFDTNSVHNDDSISFFGNRNELKQFSKVADIVIPKIVIEELRRKKLKKLINKRRSFIDNPFHNLKGLSKEETKQYDIDTFIQGLLDSEEFEFSVIDLKDNSVFDEIKDLALKKLPPFEKSDDTDKGFKDALIYFAIREYLDEIPDKYIFVCVSDRRFKEALIQHPNIIVVKNYQDFKEKSISQYYDDYFIQKVEKELTIKISKENIIEHWTNFDDNQNVYIKTDDDEFIVEVDAGEIVNSANKNQFTENLQALIGSTNFNNTDSCIDELEQYKSLFSQEEINSLLVAAYDNTQIRWIIDKDALTQFFGPLYLSNKHLVEPEKQTFFNEIFE
jgi:rRNA-processing protein FCF1